MLLREELVIRLSDLNRECRLVEGNVRLADAVPGEPPCPFRLTHFAADRERLLLQRQRLAWLAKCVVHFAQVQ
jgi:hypothetical protein